MGFFDVLLLWKWLPSLLCYLMPPVCSFVCACRLIDFVRAVWELECDRGCLVLVRQIGHVMPLKPGKGYEAIPKQFKVYQSAVRRLIYKWRTFEAVAKLSRTGHLSIFSPRSDHLMIRYIKKNPSATLCNPQISVIKLNVCLWQHSQKMTWQVWFHRR